MSHCAQFPLDLEIQGEQWDNCSSELFLTAETVAYQLP
jgi:hypothetical protein